MMRRLGLWEHRLADLIAEAQERAFQWGSHDCALFACDAVQALIGEDPGQSFRGSYATEEEAGAMLEPRGGLAVLADTIAQEHGFAVVPALLAQRGDVVLADFHGHTTLGVCIGARAAFARLPSGLVYIDMTSPAIVRAWHVD